MIYADNAATTKLDPDAFEEMRPYLTDEYGNISQPYLFSRKPKIAVKAAREDIAACIGADPDEIFFTSCGTESDNWAIKMGALSFDRVITSAIEHHAVLNSCRFIETQGKEVKNLTVDQSGEVNVEDLEKHVKNHPSLVSIMFANNEIGTIEPIRELTEIAHKHDSIIHTDAVQAVGHVQINVHELDIDMLSASAHKFNGPKGVGFIFIKKGSRLAPFMDGGEQEQGFRAGTENVASIVAMACALEKNCLSIGVNEKHLKNLESIIIAALSESGLDYIRNGSKRRIPGNISLSFAGAEGEMILHRLDLKGICISTGSACDSVNTQLSHVIQAIKVPEKYAKGTIRISLGKNNTEQEAQAIADAIVSVLKKR